MSLCFTYLTDKISGDSRQPKIKHFKKVMEEDNIIDCSYSFLTEVKFVLPIKSINP
jgi:hypothetical protein